MMRYFRMKNGAALFTLLIITMVLIFLGVSVVSLVTLQTRESIQRSNNIISRQTALAGIKYVQNLLSNNWDSITTGMVCEGVYYDENKCYYDVYVEKSNPDKCIITATGYLRDSSFGKKKLSTKGVRAIFQRPRFNSAVFSLGDPFVNSFLGAKKIPDALFTDSQYFSLVIDGTEIDGDIGTKQRVGKIIVKPKPVYETVENDDGGSGGGGTGGGGTGGGGSGGGGTEGGGTEGGGTGGGGTEGGGTGGGGTGGGGTTSYKKKMVDLFIEPYASLIIDKGFEDVVNEVRSGEELSAPLQYGVPAFPVFEGLVPLNPGNPQPGTYSGLTVTSGNVTLKGKGTYYINTLTVSGGKLNLDGGEYYIENLNVGNPDVSGNVNLSSGKYYIKNLNLIRANMTVTSKNLKPVNIFVSNRIDIQGSRLNNSRNQSYFSEEETPPNPRELIIYGTDTCQYNQVVGSQGNFVLQNLSNPITVTNSTIEGSIVGKKVDMQGGKCSLHTEIVGEGVVQLISWEEI